MNDTVFLIPVVAIAGAFLMSGLAIYAQIRKREFEHRERLAMIEKGVSPAAGTAAAPAPEAASGAPYDVDAAEDAPYRLRRGGFIVAAVGVGLWFLILMTSQEKGAALGVGGFLVIVGAALYVSSYFGTRSGERGHVPPDGRRAAR